MSLVPRSQLLAYPVGRTDKCIRQDLIGIVFEQNIVGHDCDLVRVFSVRVLRHWADRREATSHWLRE